ncbi:MAG: PAS domain S-box protein, partial [Chloroflexota bacterium]
FDAALVGPDSRVLATANGAPLELDFDTLRLIARSKELDGPAIGAPYADANGNIRFWVAAPVYDLADRRIATVLLAGDPSRKLFKDVLAVTDLTGRPPAVGTRPEPVESLLVTIDGNDLVLLSPSRLDADRAVGSRLDLAPLENTRAHDSLTDLEDGFEGVDAFGQPVLSRIRSIDDSDWEVITRVPLDAVTANANVGAGSLLVRFVIAGLVALLVVAALFLIRQRRLLRRVTQAEHEGRLANERFDQTMARTREIVLLVDADGRIRDANPAALRTYGYDAEVLRTMRIGDLRVEAERSRLGADLASAGLPGGTIYETVHQRADGSTFPVEVRTRAITVDDTLHYEGVVRDISERVAAERAIRRQLDELRRWQAGTIGREERILALKSEVNDLLIESGRAPRYASAMEGAPEHVA